MDETEWGRITQAVANKHRRRLLVALREQNPQPTDGAVPQKLYERDGEANGLQIEFRHNHLPRLEDAEFITWDRDTNEITKGPNFDDLQPLLELIENDDEPRQCWMKALV